MAGRTERTETEPGSCRSSEHPPAAFTFEVLYGIGNHSKRWILKSSCPLPVTCFLALSFCKCHRLRPEGFSLFFLLCGAGRALTVSYKVLRSVLCSLLLRAVFDGRWRGPLLCRQGCGPFRPMTRRETFFSVGPAAIVCHVRPVLASFVFREWRYGPVPRLSLARPFSWRNAPFPCPPRPFPAGFHSCCSFSLGWMDI